MSVFKFNLPFKSIFSSRNNLEQDKRFYQGFVLGAAFESVRYADQLALTYAGRLEHRRPLRDDWADEIIYIYGDLLNTEEEDTLLELFHSDNSSLIIERLRSLEVRYEAYYLELATERMTRVADTFDEAEKRTGMLMSPANWKQLDASLHSLDFTIYAQQVDEIREKIYPNALMGFQQVTFGPTEHYVLTNSGQKSDASDLWETALDNLLGRIKLGPSTEYPYRWYLKNALMSSYFHVLIERRWKDQLRKAKIDPLPEDDDLFDTSRSLFDVTTSFTRQDIERAMGKLGNPCAEIIRLKWLEDRSLAEIAEQLNYSYAYVRTIHLACLKSLGNLLTGYGN